MDDTLRRLRTGLWATADAPPRGMCATLVRGKWDKLAPADRKWLPSGNLFGCVACQHGLWRGEAVYWVLYNADRTPFVVMTSCDSRACLHNVSVVVFGRDVL